MNDMPIHPNELYASFVLSKTGPGRLGNIDTSAIRVFIHNSCFSN